MRRTYFFGLLYSNISSTESDVNIRRRKAGTAIDIGNLISPIK